MALSQALIGSEDESLVLDDGPSRRAAKLNTAERCDRRSIKETSRVEDAVSVKEEAGAVELVCARLGDGINDRARGSSVLRRVPARARDTASSRAAIDVRSLRKRYGTLEAVRGISFDVQRGEIFGLIGADGAGKTTTFQILAGVMEATGGTAEIFGKAARDARSRTGYLTQTFSLYPDLSVSENIRYIGELRHLPPAEIDERGGRYLKMFDMDRFSKRLAAQLSGGMKQKLALVCALVSEPDILLLDEPTTGVDPVSRREFWDTLAHWPARASPC